MKDDGGEAVGSLRIAMSGVWDAVAREQRHKAVNRPIRFECDPEIAEGRSTALSHPAAVALVPACGGRLLEVVLKVWITEN